ncbi:hypothetical protein ASG90_05895 [Nocardioides sp. Soil797]|nr:hypothetical protein ASG90_05895 [Nocardioides sp. Soil797]
MVFKPRDERGAVAALVAIVTVLVLVPLTSLAIDIGYQRVAARDMQAVADVVAMDMARQLDGTSTTGLLSGGSWNAALANSLSRNDDNVVGPALAATPCPAVLTANLSPGRICAVPGIYKGGVFTRSGNEPATHVLVKTQTEINYFFPVFADKGSTGKQAIAEAPAGACFAIGSYAARVRTGESPLLGPLLGIVDSDLNLDVGDYNALARANVSLLDLLSADTSVGTIDEVIKGDKLVGLSDFYLATASALAKNTAYAAQATLLQSIGLKVPNIPVKLGDLLDLDTGGSSGLDAGLNVLDLVSAAAMAANGENAITIPQLKVNLGPLAQVQVQAHVTEPPKIGCGRKDQAESQTSQVGLSIDTSAATLDLLVGKTAVELSGTIEVGAAKGKLTDVSCNPNKSIKVAVSDGLLKVDLKLEVTIKVLGIPVVGGPIRISGSVPTNGEAQKIIVNDADYDTPASVGNGQSGLPVLSVNTTAVKLIGLPVGVVLGPIINGLLEGLVNPVIQGLDAAVVSPLLSTLGVQVSGADVFALREPKCGIPALRG